MNQGRHSKFTISFWLFAPIAGAALIVSLPVELLARVGGGQSYGGGGSGGGGGGGGGGGAGAIIWLIFEVVRFLAVLTIEHPLVGIPLDVIVFGAVVYFFVRKSEPEDATFAGSVSSIPQSLDSGGAGPGGTSRAFDQLRRFDPNFSEIIFTDFCYALYGKAQDARGHGSAALDLFSPYLSQPARDSLMQRNPPNLQEVKGVIVGAMTVADVRGLDTPTVKISVMFEANYTEVSKNGAATQSEMSYYVRELWDFERRRDVLSPPPAQATALHCPRCGAPLQKDTVGACAFCQARIESGEFQWYVREVKVLSREARGPLLTADVPEEGTDKSSVMQPGFDNLRREFESNNPAFAWGEFEARARLIFEELQAAWSTLNWERARPHETDSIFQMHQYWIDAYQRQGLRNALDNCKIIAMQPMKIKEDAFYNAITLRIWAEGNDYTVDRSGKVVAGTPQRLRRWSEYWTFIRNRGAGSRPAHADLNCPNCGAPLKINATGICEFCGGKITSGDFDWVLSKIEQDESYAG